MQKVIITRKQMAQAVDSTACRLFAHESGVDLRKYVVELPNDFVRIIPRKKKTAIKDAVQLYDLCGKRIARKCWEWQRARAEIWSTLPKPIAFFASETGQISCTLRNFNMTTEPIIATPTVEIGSLTLTPQLLQRLGWMLENPKAITGITRVFDEAQVIMSASSVALLTTTTLKQAVQRKRSEFWHPGDLINFRLKTGELIRDLKNGLITPEDTRQDVSWRCVSGTGRWRLITHQYETFIDDRGVPYQLSRNLGVEAIETPTDLILN